MVPEHNLLPSIHPLVLYFSPSNFQTYAPVRDNIDFPASVQELLRFHFIRNIHLIQQASGMLLFSCVTKQVLSNISYLSYW